MQAEHMQIRPAEGKEKVEVIIREVATVNELPIKAPRRLSIAGTISAPFDWLIKRLGESDQFQERTSHLMVDREKVELTLVTNENDEYTTGKITGKLQRHPAFEAFGINTTKEWTPTNLAKFFKMNRSFFADKAENMRLVAELSNFVATVNNQIEKSANEKGDRSDKFVQTVNSNLPQSFKLRMPLFKGTTAQDIEVETYATVDGRDVSFVLISPGANEALEDLRDNAIDSELKRIADHCAGLVIIEQ